MSEQSTKVVTIFGNKPLPDNEEVPKRTSSPEVIESIKRILAEAEAGETESLIIITKNSACNPPLSTVAYIGEEDAPMVNIVLDFIKLDLLQKIRPMIVRATD